MALSNANILFRTYEPYCTIRLLDCRHVCTALKFANLIKCQAELLQRQLYILIRVCLLLDSIFKRNVGREYSLKSRWKQTSPLAKPKAKRTGLCTCYAVQVLIC